MKKLEELKDLLEASRKEDFGTLIKLTSDYPKPEVYPTKGEHPRVLVNKQQLDKIRKNLTAEENKNAYAEYLRLSELTQTGILPEPSEHTYNIDYNILASIEAKAFRYLMTGEEIFGLEALVAIKNYIKTVIITKEIHDDCRAYGYVMYIAACVYDWCYKLLTETDMKQIVAGCQTYLAPGFEMSFPPTKQGALTGHGTEAQLMRDWLSLSNAAYDEYPDLYEMVGGRLFEEFRADSEFYLASGSHWQGSAYGPYRYHFMLYLEALIRAMTNNTFRFYSENLARPAVTFLQYLRPDGQSLRVGDDFNEKSRPYSLQPLHNSSFYAAALYGDPVVKGIAYEGLKEFSTFTVSNNSLSAVMLLALNNPEAPRAPLSDLPLVHENGSPLGSLISRSAWEDDAFMTYMKVGEAYSANHEHKDAGSFQIYYKGILASDSGLYGAYGSDHDLSYVKQTISSNCLLVFNPSMTDNGKWRYSGGQTIAGKSNGENARLSGWLAKSTSRQAKIIGCDFKADKTHKYSYLAGDLTNSYDSETVGDYSRYMLSVSTDNGENPMAFFVYDRVSAVDSGFKKTFLLHIQQEPEIGEGSAIVTNTRGGNSGKMHVQSLLTEMDYTVIGGEGKEYVVNGENIVPVIPYPDTDICESGWGRIEISPKQSAKTDRLLTVMYVTDASNNAAPTKATEIDSDKLVGAVIFGKAALFAKSSGELSGRVEFKTEGTELDYHIAGLAAGRWEVTVDEKSLGELELEPGKLLSFNAACGNVVLTLK